MKKVAFLTPNNEFIKMNYWEVEDFCKEICLRQENFNLFNEFKKDYIYFTPYFDFVMKMKKYIFFNCLFNKEYFLIFNEEAYYFSYIVSDDYQDNVSNFKFIKKYLEVSDLTLISDRELDIKLQKPEYEDDCIIDPNGVGMMSKTGVASDYGSHVVTGSTILNHLLIKSKIITEYFYKYLNVYNQMYFREEISLEYLIEKLGFLRVACRDCYPIIINNKNVLSSCCINFCNIAESLYNYKIVDMEEENYYINKEYQKVIKNCFK